MIQTFKDVENEIHKMRNELDQFRSRNIDLTQRRIVNAHPSVDAYDYVIRKELLDKIQGVQGTTIQQVQNVTLFDKGTFGFSIQGSLIVGTDVCPHYPFIHRTTLIEAYAKLKVACTGKSVLVDIKRWTSDGISSASIFGLTKLTIPVSTTTVVYRTGFDISSFSQLEWLTADIVQVGSGVPGGTLVVVLKFEVT